MHNDLKDMLEKMDRFFEKFREDKEALELLSIVLDMTARAMHLAAGITEELIKKKTEELIEKTEAKKE